MPPAAHTHHTPHTHQTVPSTLLVVANSDPALDHLLTQARAHGVVVARTDNAAQAGRWLKTLHPDLVMAPETAWPQLVAALPPAGCPTLTWDGDTAALRQHLARQHPTLGDPMPLLNIGVMRVDEARGLVGRALPDGRLLQTPVAPIELRLLLCLVRQQGRFVTRSDLLRQVWSADEQPQARTVDQVVRRLRIALTAVGLAPTLRSLRGLGYRLDVS